MVDGSGTTRATPDGTSSDDLLGSTSQGDAEELVLEVEVADGRCTDLSVIDRQDPAVEFKVKGPPGAFVELWSKKKECGVAAFVYKVIELDAGGQGAFNIFHTGSNNCQEGLLGRWTAWIELDAERSGDVDITFANATCTEAVSCQAARDFCPTPAAGALIPKEELWTLSEGQRALFTPPDPNWLNWGTNYEDYPLHNLWDAFDLGLPPAPLGLAQLPAGWFALDGGGSQNHALLWVSVAALGYGFAGDVASFDQAAALCLELLELDQLQGHMRHEAIGGYTGYWEGGIAAMAIAGLYAPEDSLYGAALLAASRKWWAEHIAVLRALAMPDGQIAIVGARLAGAPGTQDNWKSLSAAVNLQLLDLRPHDDLHPSIAALVTADGEPGPGTNGVPINWFRPRHIAERWVVLRAIQSGALPSVPANQPPPKMVQSVFRWAEGDALMTAIPMSKGFRPARFSMRWTPGQTVEVVVGDPTDTPAKGKGPHAPPEPVGIPAEAEQVL